MFGRQACSLFCCLLLLRASSLSLRADPKSLSSLLHPDPLHNNNQASNKIGMQTSDFYLSHQLPVQNQFQRATSTEVNHESFSSKSNRRDLKDALHKVQKEIADGDLDGDNTADDSTDESTDNTSDNDDNTDDDDDNNNAAADAVQQFQSAKTDTPKAKDVDSDNDATAITTDLLQKCKTYLKNDDENKKGAYSVEDDQVSPCHVVLSLIASSCSNEKKMSYKSFSIARCINKDEEEPATEQFVVGISGQTLETPGILQVWEKAFGAENKAVGKSCLVNAADKMKSDSSDLFLLKHTITSFLDHCKNKMQDELCVEMYGTNDLSSNDPELDAQKGGDYAKDFPDAYPRFPDTVSSEWINKLWNKEDRDLQNDLWTAKHSRGKCSEENCATYCDSNGLVMASLVTVATPCQYTTRFLSAYANIHKEFAFVISKYDTMKNWQTYQHHLRQRKGDQN